MLLLNTNKSYEHLEEGNNCAPNNCGEGREDFIKT